MTDKARELLDDAAERAQALRGDVNEGLTSAQSQAATITHSKTERVHISTPKVLVGEKSATALALVVHELATNSIKYGALSNANGALDVKCSVNGSHRPTAGLPTGSAEDIDAATRSSRRHGSPESQYHRSNLRWPTGR